MEYREVYPIEIVQGFTEDCTYVMMMYDPKESRNVPIIIGQHEADMILIEREHKSQEVRRPMTHELISVLMESFHLALKEVTIDRFLEGVFYATLHVTDGFTTKKIDSRSSDAIVLALREEVPILMSSAIIEETGFEVDAEYIDPTPEEETMTLEQLEQKMKEYEEAEEYEKAAAILERIKRME